MNPNEQVQDPPPAHPQGPLGSDPLKDYTRIEKATGSHRGEVGRLGTAVLFIVLIMVAVGSAFTGIEQHYLLVAAAVIGAYMAMNIGANDVANNVGPAVGSLALSMTGAIAIAAIFEAGGAVIAGGDVVNTVKNGIINPDDLPNADEYVWVMMGALLGAAVWLNLATWFKAPVSTTHSIVGGVMGAAMAAAGSSIVNWPAVATIALSWVVSPLMGGLIAAAVLYMLERLVFFQRDPISAARWVVPMLIGVMGWSFTTYLLLKGLAQITDVGFGFAAVLGLAVGALAWWLTRRMVMRTPPGGDFDRDAINKFFTVPLIAAAALLSFAHGANDVANAVGPLAGIVDVLTMADHGGDAKVSIPWWVLAIGAAGISLGLALFGPKLIRTVGSEITELDRSRAFCIALSAGLTVIVASQMGLPISSTHVALGAVFGVGFLREWFDLRLGRVVESILAKHEGDPDLARTEAFLHEFVEAPVDEKQRILTELKKMGREAVITAAQRKQLQKALKRQLVHRRSLLKIVAAWLITLPVSAFLSALFYFALRGMMLEV